MFTLKKLESSQILNNEMADHVVSLLNKSILTRGTASLAVSGGKTPIEFFKILSQKELDWNKVFITLVDDRWVDTNNESSNEKLVFDYLLQNKAKNAVFVGLKNDATTPFEGMTKTESNLKKVPTPFDLVILGMGEDGHTASLFPHAQNLKEGLNLKSGKTVIGMTPLTAPLDRITLTLPAILNSKNIFLHLVGENKIKILNEAKAGTCEEEMPIRSVLHQINVDVTVYWTKQ